jgi:NAD(P)-dependent dehydrogenase (short-subunit alcohol dehydrogenase family)
MAETAAPHALVTGASRGIGRGVAEALLAAGWTVTAAAVDGAELEALPDRKGLSRAILDVTDEAGVARCIAGLARLDGLVNCAGIIARAAEFEIEGFRRVIEVNLVGTMRMCMAALPLLKARGGAIVNTASMFSIFGSPLSPGYTASKGGVAQLTKSLAVAWARDGVRVNAIAPGWIETAITRPLVDDPARSAAILARTPMGRWGVPEDVGSVAVFLLSPAARFVTGVVLPVDGGYAVA